MRDEDTIVEIIRQIGLRNDSRDLYGHDTRYMNSTMEGLYQIPRQLAKAMLLLSRHDIRTFLEVGTEAGYTASILTAYLYRFNSELEAVTIDPWSKFTAYERVRSLIPIEFRSCASAELRGKVFDCVLIDGDHSYRGVREDYENVGRHARICMFHDINDAFVGFDNVPRFWKELAASDHHGQMHEFLDCTPGRNIMGIGVHVARANAPLLNRDGHGRAEFVR